MTESGQQVHRMQLIVTQHLVSNERVSNEGVPTLMYVSRDDYLLIHAHYGRR